MRVLTTNGRANWHHQRRAKPLAHRREKIKASSVQHAGSNVADLRLVGVRWCENIAGIIVDGERSSAPRRYSSAAQNHASGGRLRKLLLGTFDGGIEGVKAQIAYRRINKTTGATEIPACSGVITSKKQRRIYRECETPASASSRLRSKHNLTPYQTGSACCGSNSRTKRKRRSNMYGVRAAAAL